jgi:hypothetical protein
MQIQPLLRTINRQSGRTYGSIAIIHPRQAQALANQRFTQHCVIAGCPGGLKHGS